MEITKVRSRLVFKDEERGHCEFDLADCKCYKNIRGKIQEVKTLNSYFKNLDFMRDIYPCFKDEAYKKFVKHIHNHCDFAVTNTGTILQKLSGCGHMEQFFSSGIDCAETIYSATIGDIPKEFVRLFRVNGIRVDNYSLAILTGKRGHEDVVELYKNSLLYASRNFDNSTVVKVYNMLRGLSSSYGAGQQYRRLVQEFNYEYKALLDYLFVKLPNREAIEGVSALTEVIDTAYMLRQMTITPRHPQGRYDKYFKYLKTTHDIVRKNYNTFKTTYDEEQFLTKVNKDLEYITSGYSIIVPKSTSDIKKEGIDQSNCVASYIPRILKGDTQIVFLRRESTESLVTVEITNNVICQAYQNHNTTITKEQREFLHTYAKTKKLKVRGI